MVIRWSPFSSPVGQSESEAFPSAMFTMVRISSTMTVPSRLQSPTQGRADWVGVGVRVGGLVDVGAVGGVEVGVSVAAGDGVNVSVAVQAGVAVGIGVSLGVALGASVGVGIGVPVGVLPAVKVGEGASVGVVVG
jgi:hypothetical protein